MIYRVHNMHTSNTSFCYGELNKTIQPVHCAAQDGQKGKWNNQYYNSSGMMVQHVVARNKQLHNEMRCTAKSQLRWIKLVKSSRKAISGSKLQKGTDVRAAGSWHAPPKTSTAAVQHPQEALSNYTEFKDKATKAKKTRHFSISSCFFKDMQENYHCWVSPSSQRI